MRGEVLTSAGRKTEFMIYELLALRATDDPELRVRDRANNSAQ
jgi:hypothetical protein